MTKTIPLNTGTVDSRAKLPDGQLVKAAWFLVYAALWNHRTFSQRETSRAQLFIRQHLMADIGTGEKAFLVFCERILLAHGQLTRSRHRRPMPSVWLSKNLNGFTATLKSYQRVETMRQHIDGYLSETRLFAWSYRRSISDSVATSYEQCRLKLVQLREYALWNLFCQALCCYHFHYPVKP